jgi:primary-amine oxidase
MTTVADPAADRNRLVHEIDRPADHPLRRLTAAEMTSAREVLERAGLVTADTRFVYVGLHEPEKRDVRAYQRDPSHHVDRRCRMYLLDQATGQGSRVVISLDDQSIVSNIAVDPVRDGQVSLLDEEFEIADKLVAADESWCAALRRRGIDPAKVRGVPLSAGHFGFTDEIGKRMARVVGFCQEDALDLPWAHPIDGLVAYVDLTARTIQKIVDDADLPVPAERGEWDAEPHASPRRNTLKPLEITQPEGPSFTVHDDVLTWENWSVRIGFDGREGLTLHEVSFLDNGRRRPVLYRASVAEMVVFYADPSPSRFYQNYFDTGEYMFCRYTNSLKLGCDCLGEIHYLDATIADDHGRPCTIENAICIHEEDYGLLWKHNDMFNGMSESRRSRRLVISFFTTIGNYDYGFYWYLYLDGTIEVEAKATGVVFTARTARRSRLPHTPTPMAPGSGRAVPPAPVLRAPGHGGGRRRQLRCDELDAQAPGPDGTESNPHGNAFTRSVHHGWSASPTGSGLADGSLGRVWRIVQPGEAKSPWASPVGYVTLHSRRAPPTLADGAGLVDPAGAPNFATKHLWVTALRRRGALPGRGVRLPERSATRGLPDVGQGRPIATSTAPDIVLWHSFGLTHFPRPEDWPVMPDGLHRLHAEGRRDSSTSNPALDVPPNGGSCHS